MSHLQLLAEYNSETLLPHLQVLKRQPACRCPMSGCEGCPLPVLSMHAGAHTPSLAVQHDSCQGYHSECR